MHFFRNKLLAFLASFLILWFVMTLPGCNEHSSAEKQEESKAFFKKAKSQISDFMAFDISQGSISRSGIGGVDSMNSSGFGTIYVDFSDFAEPPRPFEEYDGELTPADLLRLAQEYGAEFSTENDGSHDDSIKVSSAKIEQSLQPLLFDSRTYLKKRGLSNEDMDAIVAEYEYDNSCLITLAMTIASCDERFGAEPLGYTSNGLKELFVQRACAASAGEMFGNCVWKVSGLDDLSSLFRYAAAEKLTRQFAIRILKITLPKAFGWVGTAVMLVEFVDCIANYDRYY